MSSIDEVKRIAKLARIEINDVEAAQVQKKFQNILGYFERLNEVDTEGVAPFFHATAEMSPREDIAQKLIDREDVLKNAPDSFESCFRIPKVVGEME